MQTRTLSLRRVVDRLTIHEIRGELRELRDERTTLDAIIALYEQALAYKEQRGEADEHEESGSMEHQPHERSAPNGEIKRGRDAVRAVITSEPAGKHWRIPDVVKALHARGWPGNDHSVQVALSRMRRSGELERPDMGVYRLPVREGTPSLLGGDDVA